MDNSVVVSLRDIVVEFDGQRILDGLNLDIHDKEFVTLLGSSGCGKTTLLRIIMGQVTPDTGSVDYGHGCKIGYFAQEHDTLDLNATVLENLIHVAPELNDTQARSILGSFLFSGDDALKPARVLSGGEKTRLALATLVTSRANVLLLDEPTNDIDVNTMRALEDGLENFAGCVLVVSHDRWFLDRIATHIMAFEGDSSVVFFDGNYSEYEEARKKRLGKDADQPHRLKFRKLTR